MLNKALSGLTRSFQGLNSTSAFITVYYCTVRSAWSFFLCLGEAKKLIAQYHFGFNNTQKLKETKMDMDLLSILAKAKEKNSCVSGFPTDPRFVSVIVVIWNHIHGTKLFSSNIIILINTRMQPEVEKTSSSTVNTFPCRHIQTITSAVVHFTTTRKARVRVRVGIG